MGKKSQYKKATETETVAIEADPKTSVKGKPKSGRIWKSERERFTTVKKSTQRNSFDKLKKFREDMKHIKDLSKTIKEDKRLENETKRLRREENMKRRQENERKNEIVQIIKNPAKLKRMRKKQLRQIEKRDLSQVKVV